MLQDQSLPLSFVFYIFSFCNRLLCFSFISVVLLHILKQFGCLFEGIGVVLVCSNTEAIIIVAYNTIAYMFAS